MAIEIERLPEDVTQVEALDRARYAVARQGARFDAAEQIKNKGTLEWQVKARGSTGVGAEAKPWSVIGHGADETAALVDLADKLDARSPLNPVEDLCPTCGQVRPAGV